MRVKLFALLLCLVSFPLVAADAYTIDIEIAVSDSILHSPTISVKAGKEAKITTQDYEYLLVAKTQKDNQVSILMSLTIDGETVEPSFLVKLGQESSVSIGEIDLKVVVERYAKEHT